LKSIAWQDKINDQPPEISKASELQITEAKPGAASLEMTDVDWWKHGAHQSRLGLARTHTVFSSLRP